MKLTKALTALGHTEKVASEAAPSSTNEGSSEKTAAASATGEKLRTALREVNASLSTAPAEKTAATASPIADLMKTASSVASAEHEALVKEAQLYGAACCDGFMARLSQYNEAADKLGSQQPTKTAALALAPAANDESFDKFASENPDLVKEAAELGYQTTMQQMEKLAGAAYESGYNQAVTQIYKTAHATFVRGFEDVAQLLTERR